jgi:nitroreductase
MVYEAPLVIVVCGDAKEAEKYWVQDCSAATENILLAATALGLGSVWLGVHPRLERKEALRQLFELPDNIEILSMIAIGYAAETKPERTQYDASRIRQESW